MMERRRIPLQDGQAQHVGNVRTDIHQVKGHVTFCADEDDFTRVDVTRLLAVTVVSR